MDPALQQSMAVFAVTLGAAAWFYPVERYRMIGEIGFSGGLLFTGGIVLLTHFIWSTIALEVSGARLQLTRAEERIAALTGEISEANVRIAGLQEEASPDVRNARLEGISRDIFERLNAVDSGIDEATVSNAVAASFTNAGVAPIDEQTLDETIIKNNYNAVPGFSPNLFEQNSNEFSPRSLDHSFDMDQMQPATGN